MPTASTARASFLVDGPRDIAGESSEMLPADLDDAESSRNLIGLGSASSLAVAVDDGSDQLLDAKGPRAGSAPARRGSTGCSRSLGGVAGEGEEMGGNAGSGRTKTSSGSQGGRPPVAIMLSSVGQAIR